MVFLSHCLINENTRYPGGAGRAACVREILDQCVAGEIGIVQMPCPEETAWGGVRKPGMLQLYRVARRLPGGVLERAVVPAALRATRSIYRRLARRVADQIEDYIRSGYSVVAVVGVDGSPSCGVSTTIDVPALVRDVRAADPARLSLDDHNALIRRRAQPGRGLFLDELAAELGRRRIQVPVLAHDMIGELAGLPSTLDLAAADRGASD